MGPDGSGSGFVTCDAALQKVATSSKTLHTMVREPRRGRVDNAPEATAPAHARERRAGPDRARSFQGHGARYDCVAPPAPVAELADAQGLGPCVRKDVWVQVPPGAPKGCKIEPRLWPLLVVTSA